MDLLLLAESALYLAAAFSSLISVTAIASTEGAFSGHCIIFGTVALQGSTVIVQTFGSSSACRFPLTASIFTAIYCFSNVAYWAFSACMGQVHRSRSWSSWDALFLSVLALLVLTAACELRSGLGYFCSSLFEVASRQHPLKTCRDAQKLNWTREYQTSNFYDHAVMGETTLWVELLLLLALVLLLVTRVHIRENESCFPLPRYFGSVEERATLIAAAPIPT
uniref:transmembrane protein 179B-like n=1 Tax=Myxine glutinosa TaxID=7769 RepID=UPI00358F1593